MKRLLNSMVSFGRSGLFYLGLKAAGFVKMSYIIGSHLAFFSAANVLYPVGGLWLGVSGSCVWFALGTLIRFSIGVPFYYHFIYGIPGFCAALYMARSHIAIRLLLPLVCMILFVVHPVGFAAAPYSFYWLIPIIFYFIKKRSLFTEALGATFVAHAVGSVFWLYLIPMPATYWCGLVPLVAIERISFAAGSVLVYSFCKYGLRMLNKLRAKGSLVINVKNGNA